MKVLRNVFCLAIVSFVFSIVCTYAASSVAWAPVTLSASSSIYSSNTYTKSVDYCTGVYKTDAVDALTGASRAVSTRVGSNDTGAWINTSWKTTVTKDYVTWGSSTDCYAAYIRAQLKASTSTLTKVKFYGVFAYNYYQHS